MRWMPALALLTYLFVLLLTGCAAEVIPPDVEVEVTIRPSSRCVPRPLMLTGLALQFNEVPIASGYTREGLFMEVLTPEDKQTFSIIYTSPVTGISCIIWHGDGWLFMAPAEG